MNDRISLFGVGLDVPPSYALKNSAQNHNHTNTTNSPGSCLNIFDSTGIKRKWCDADGSGVVNAETVLGLGQPSSSSENSKKSSAIDDGSFILNLGKESSVSTEKIVHSAPKACGVGSNFNLQLSLSVGLSKSVITSAAPVSAHHHTLQNLMTVSQDQALDEGSTSARWKRGTLLFQHLNITEKGYSLSPPNQLIAESASVLPVPTFSSSSKIQTLKSSLACASGVIHPQQRNSNTKICQSPGCTKGARGASGLCIAHGGGRRCQKDGCNKGAEGKTIFCKAHGGGRRCDYLGCTKSAEGRTDYCIAHGGGRRCSEEGCSKAARGKSGRCIKHGGGKRCQKENCTKSAEGQSGLCISHGGGRRCKYPECTKGAQGSTNFCKAHGGGKRCTRLGCTKGAEGRTPFCKAHGGGKRCAFQGGCTKSVHGGTLFCVAHGGGKRCAALNCTKSARGRTSFCVGHGGGKRCKTEGCLKSAQGKTDFCKAHGGGRRCLWGQPGSDVGAGDDACDHFARGKKGLCAAHSALVEDHCVHGASTLVAANSEDGTQRKSHKMKEMVRLDRYPEKEKGKNIVLGWGGHDQRRDLNPTNLPSPGMPFLPEGRVHGGSLMSLLSSNATLGSHSASQADSAGNSELGIPQIVVRSWI